MYKFFRLRIVILFLSLSIAAGSYAFMPDSTYRYMVQGMSVVSTKQTPFWMVNNRLGLSSLNRSNGYLRAAAFRDIDSTRRFSWGAGVDLVAPYNFTSKFVIQQLYGEVKYRSLQLTVGSKERYMGLVNQELSSGDMVFSLNARPIPQVHLAMPDYQWVPLTRNWLAIKGFFSFGMFTDGRWEQHRYDGHASWDKNVLYHTKGVFLRGGNTDRFPLTVEGGFEMGTQFGGKCFIYKGNGKYDIVNMRHGFKQFLEAIFGLSGGDADDPWQDGEISNCYGNHVGEWSLAATWAPKNAGWSVKAYYQHYFEDHSQLFFDYAWKDMLLGTEITLPQNPLVDKFVYEYLYTKDQSGPVYWDHTPDIPVQISGRDNYYNHSIYTGWQHWGMCLGNPLLLSPIYSDANKFDHTRLIGHHFGLSGRPSDEFYYRILLSATRSWGTYFNRPPKVMKNFNGLLEVTYSPRRIPGWSFRIGVAGDHGDIVRNTFGGMLTITKTGLL